MKFTEAKIKCVFFMFLAVLSVDFINFARADGIPQSRDGQLKQPSGLAVDKAGNIYVGEWFSGFIKVFSPQGHYLRKLGGPGSRPGQFKGLIKLAINKAGIIYAIDQRNHRIQKFDLQGHFLGQWGKPAEFRSLTGIAVDQSNNVYVADGDAGGIQKFDADGRFLLKWAPRQISTKGSNSPDEIAVDAAGHLYVTCSGDIVQEFDGTGNFLGSWGGTGTGDGKFSFLNGIALDQQENIYTTETENNRVQKFNHEGKYLAQWQVNAPEGDQWDYLAIALGHAGQVYVADDNQGVVKTYDSKAKSTGQWGESGPGSFEDSEGIGVDAQGNVYVDKNHNPVFLGLPKTATIVEEQNLKTQGYPDRTLVLWMENPKKKADEMDADDPYTCPEQTTGRSYYIGPVRVSLLDAGTRRVINTVKADGVEKDDPEQQDSFTIPLTISPDYYYHTVGDHSSKGEPKAQVLYLKDYTGQGKALQFALFYAEACMGLETTLIGYSPIQDKVIHYPIVLEVFEASGKEKKSISADYWCDYLFSEKPIQPGFWNYGIDYRGRGGALESYLVHFNSVRERFEGTLTYGQDNSDSK